VQATIAKISTIDKDGNNIFKNAAIKGANTKSKTIVNGYDIHTLAVRKAAQTKLDDVDEHGKNMYQRCHNKRTNKHVETLSEWELYQYNVKVKEEYRITRAEQKLINEKKKKEQYLKLKAEYGD